MTNIPTLKVLNRLLFTGFLAIICLSSHAQELTGNALLEKAIAYHDPNGNWSTLKASLTVEMKKPKATERITKIKLNLPAQFYSATVQKDGSTTTSVLDKENCTLMYNGSTDIPKPVRDSLRLTCDRAKMMRDYYTYLYGLPMKLKDPGTNIYEKVERKTINNKEYLVLKVDYDENVGKDTWYFYFDPKTYAMEAYQFFHEESKNDGEYILLTDMLEVNNIKMPKTRTWYYNKGNVYLATDVLTKAARLD